jgi:hypothetical protein
MFLVLGASGLQEFGGAHSLSDLDIGPLAFKSGANYLQCSPVALLKCTSHPLGFHPAITTAVGIAIGDDRALRG